MTDDIQRPTPQIHKHTFTTAVVIDLDDTFFLETDYARSGYRAVARKFRQSEGMSEAIMWDILHSGDRRNVLSRWLDEVGLPAEKLPRAIEVYRTHVPDMKPIPGWDQLLASWKGVHGRGVVTDGPERQQAAKVIGSGIRAHVDAIVLSDSLGGPEFWKPNPAPYLECLRRLGGVAPERAVYVGDNPHKDFLGARNAGMRSIRLRWPGGLHADVMPADDAHAPDIEVTTIDGVRDAVAELLGSPGPRAEH